MEDFMEAMAFELNLQGSICAFNKYLLSTYYVPSSILCAFESIHEQKDSCSHGASILVEG